jgi:hypothetical protein
MEAHDEQVEWEMIQGTEVESKPQFFIDHLIYCSYRHNRELTPEITPAQWEKIFGSKTKQLEERFQWDQQELRSN